jgi:tetratricopeptide (TPR) repeat protein
MYISAWYAIANRAYPAAVDRYRELVAAYPRETEAYVRLGHLLRGEERFDEAIAALKQGLGIDPQAEDLYNALGGIYSQQGRHDEALAMENRYTALAPTEANARDSLALAYQWAGRFPEAEREYRRAIELDPAFDIPPLHLGMLHFRMGRYREALAEFRRQATVAPSDLQRQSDIEYIAEARWKMGDSAGAEQEMERCIRIYPGYPFIRMQLALWHKDRPLARSLVSDISRMPVWTHRGARPPYQRGVYYLRGQLALLEGENAKALEMFREASRHWSGWADFNTFDDCLGDAYLQLGRWDEAVAEYKRVLRLFPGTALARYHLASAYDHSGQEQLARAEFVRFLDLWKDADPDIQEVRTAREYLKNRPSLRPQ